jgi:flagellar hook assembly protein FlgD
MAVLNVSSIGINHIAQNVPDKFSLEQNYPNPFNPVTKIRFEVALDSRLRGNDNVVLKVYDILGREVTTLVNKQLNPGTYEVEWDGLNSPSGLYLCKMAAGNYSETRKMVLVK